MRKKEREAVVENITSQWDRPVEGVDSRSSIDREQTSVSQSASLAIGNVRQKAPHSMELVTRNVYNNINIIANYASRDICEIIKKE